MDVNEFTLESFDKSQQAKPSFVPPLDFNTKDISLLTQQTQVALTGRKPEKKPLMDQMKRRMSKLMKIKKPDEKLNQTLDFSSSGQRNTMGLKKTNTVIGEQIDEEEEAGMKEVLSILQDQL